MSAYRCYHHPKVEAGHMCRGCKLPLCAGCHGGVGYCPDCAKKRAVVEELRALRNSMPGVGAITSKLPPVASSPSFQALPPVGRPRRAVSRPFSASAKRAITGRLSREAEPQPRRFNHEAVAYRPPVALPQRAGKPRAAEPAEGPAAKPAWLMPFTIGLGVGMLVVLVVVVGLTVLHDKQQPKHDGLSATERAAVARMLASKDEEQPVASRNAGALGVRFVDLPAGTTLSQMTYLQAHVKSPKRLSSLVLMVDGEPHASTTAVNGVSELRLDPHALSPGAHRLRLDGYAWGGNRLVASSDVTVHIGR